MGRGQRFRKPKLPNPEQVSDLGGSRLYDPRCAREEVRPLGEATSVGRNVSYCPPLAVSVSD